LSDGELGGADGGEVAGEDGSLGLLTVVGGLADASGSALLVHAPKGRANVTVAQISALVAALALIGLTALLPTSDPSKLGSMLTTGPTIPSILYEAVRGRVPSCSNRSPRSEDLRR
jgi:hypothetical protein